MFSFLNKNLKEYLFPKYSGKFFKNRKIRLLIRVDGLSCLRIEVRRLSKCVYSIPNRVLLPIIPPLVQICISVLLVGIWCGLPQIRTSPVASQISQIVPVHRVLGIRRISLWFLCGLPLLCICIGILGHPC